MKAARLIAYGGPEAIQVSDVAEPSVGQGQVLVEIHSAGVNPFDWKVQAGYLKDFIPLTLPVILGGDLAGVIKELGEGVSNFQVGDEVFGQADFKTGGSFAQLSAIKNDKLAVKPNNLDFAQAASLPLAGSSALQALEDHINLQSSQKILIHGGAGGIGSYAVQIAKNLGAYVATTVSGNDMEYVKELGADQIINYKEEKFEDQVKDYDAVFDLVGGETCARSLKVLRRGGVLVSMVGPIDKEASQNQGVTALSQMTEVTSEKLNKLRELAENAKLKVHIEKEFPLDQSAEALDFLRNSSPRGKVVIKVK